MRDDRGTWHSPAMPCCSTLAVTRSIRPASPTRAMWATASFVGDDAQCRSSITKSKGWPTPPTQEELVQRGCTSTLARSGPTMSGPPGRRPARSGQTRARVLPRSPSSRRSSMSGRRATTSETMALKGSYGPCGPSVQLPSTTRPPRWCTSAATAAASRDLPIPASPWMTATAVPSAAQSPQSPQFLVVTDTLTATGDRLELMRELTEPRCSDGTQLGPWGRRDCGPRAFAATTRRGSPRCAPTRAVERQSGRWSAAPPRRRAPRSHAA